MTPASRALLVVLAPTLCAAQQQSDLQGAYIQRRVARLHIGANGEAESLLTEANLAPWFRRVDHNRDGKISPKDVGVWAAAFHRAKARDQAEDILAESDEDDDGKVTVDELIAWQFKGKPSGVDQRRLERHFVSCDMDLDDKLDEDELAAYVDPWYHKDSVHWLAHERMYEMDDDRDGHLNMEEWSPHFRRPGLGAPSKDPEKAKMEFYSLDKNYDNHLSVEELKAWEKHELHAADALEEVMKVADADEDGSFSLRELVKAVPQLSGTRAEHRLTEWVKDEL